MRSEQTDFLHFLFIFEEINWLFCSTEKWRRVLQYESKKWQEFFFFWQEVEILGNAFLSQQGSKKNDDKRSQRKER